jgi:hypothetical protein
LLNEDAVLRDSLRERLTGYHRSCAPGAACSTCGLSCVTPIP